MSALLGICFACTLALASPAAAQFEIGLGFNIAETETNAIGLGSTFVWNPSGAFALRGFIDGEYGIPGLKEGLDYQPGSNREYIADQDGLGVPQNPRGDELWDGQGVHIHTALYGTVTAWRLSAGPGLAYNGHDGSITSGLAFVLIGHITSRSELDVELLKGGSWRARIAIGFWRFP